jgi:hypothetical protein
MKLENGDFSERKFLLAGRSQFFALFMTYVRYLILIMGQHATQICLCEISLVQHKAVQERSGHQFRVQKVQTCEHRATAVALRLTK